jgi:hypothetical protein
MIWTLLKLGLIVLFPRILGSFLGTIRNRRPIRESIRLSRYAKSDMITVGFAVVYAFALIGKILGRLPTSPPNYFRETRTPFDAPSYLVRNHYRSYLEHLQASDPLINEFLASVGTDNLMEAEVPERFAKVASQLKRLERLSHEMRVKENKQLYFLAGEQPYLNCHLCDKKQPHEFLLFAAPSIVLQYCLFLAAVGILCHRKARRALLIPTLLYALSLVAHDVFSFYFAGYASPVFLYNQLFPSAINYLTKYEQLEIVRSGLMALFLAFALLFEFPPRKDETLVLLEKSITEAKMISDKLLVERTSKGVILGDDHLRKAYFDNLQKHSSKFIASLTPADRQKLSVLYTPEVLNH